MRPQSAATLTLSAEKTLMNRDDDFVCRNPSDVRADLFLENKQSQGYDPPMQKTLQANRNQVTVCLLWYLRRTINANDIISILQPMCQLVNDAREEKVVPHIRLTRRVVLSSSVPLVYSRPGSLHHNGSEFNKSTYCQPGTGPCRPCQLTP